MSSQFGHHVMGIDADYNVVLAHKKVRRNDIIGDATDYSFWVNLEPGNVSLVLLTMNNFSANKVAVIRLNQSNFTGKIAAIAHNEDEIKELKNLGVDWRLIFIRGQGLALPSMYVMSSSPSSRNLSSDQNYPTFSFPISGFLLCCCLQNSRHCK